jgi:nitrite reductase/ring-hydroxylating ferredoxin subunit
MADAKRPRGSDQSPAARIPISAAPPNEDARRAMLDGGVPGTEWQAEFPYRWREDDVMTRRDTLRFLVAGSGALFLATTAMAIAGNLPSGPGVHAVPVAQVGELAENEWRVFNFPDQYGQGIIINVPGRGLVAYSDVCTHLSCAVLYEGDEKHLHCPCHDGLFDAATGDVLSGPPTRPLPFIQLAIHEGTIYAVKEIPR